MRFRRQNFKGRLRRVVDQGKVRRGRLARSFSLFLAVGFAVALLHVWVRMLVVQTGYRVRSLMEQQEILKGESHTLKMEVALLRAPDRLEKVAKKLGLTNPPEAQVTLISSRVP